MIYFVSNDVTSTFNIGVVSGERTTIVKDILASPDKDIIWDLDDFRSQTTILKYLSIPYNIIIGVPGYHTPSDFMTETDHKHICTFDQLMKTDFGKEKFSVVNTPELFSSDVEPDEVSHMASDDEITLGG